MAVPKKHTSISKKCIHKNIWKKKGYRAALKAFSLAKSLFTGNSKSFFFYLKSITKHLNNFYELYSKLNALICVSFLKNFVIS